MIIKKSIRSKNIVDAGHISINRNHSLEEYSKEEYPIFIQIGTVEETIIIYLNINEINMFKEILNDKKQKVEVKVWCEKCKGLGYKKALYPPSPDCPACQGRGYNLKQVAELK